MSKQTAVEWLEKCFASHWNYEEHAKWDGLIQQAKQMEKEQIVDAHLLGLVLDLTKDAYTQAEEFYQENYGGDHE